MDKHTSARFRGQGKTVSDDKNTGKSEIATGGNDGGREDSQLDTPTPAQQSKRFSVGGVRFANARDAMIFMAKHR